MICLRCGERGEYKDFSYEEHKYNLCYRCIEKIRLENSLNEYGDSDDRKL